MEDESLSIKENELKFAQKLLKLGYIKPPKIVNSMVTDSQYNMIQILKLPIEYIDVKIINAKIEFLLEQILFLKISLN